MKSSSGDQTTNSKVTQPHCGGDYGSPNNLGVGTGQIAVIINFLE